MKAKKVICGAMSVCACESVSVCAGFGFSLSPDRTEGLFGLDMGLFALGSVGPMSIRFVVSVLSGEGCAFSPQAVSTHVHDVRRRGSVG